MGDGFVPDSDSPSSQDLVDARADSDVAPVGGEDAGEDLSFTPDIQAPPDIDNSMRPTCDEPEGPWRLYFSKPVDDEDICGDVKLDRALAYWIGRATNSVDIALYSLNAMFIGNAILAAHERGVTVRIIANKDDARLTTLGEAGIDVLIDPDEDRLMHHKFVIIDDTWVWFGSANGTTQSGRGDANNVIVAESPAFATALSEEFESLWLGGFHTHGKEPASFYLDGGAADLHFTPSYDVEDELLNLIYEADHEIQVAMLAFTRQRLADALVDRCGEVDIAVVADSEPVTGEPYPSWYQADLSGCASLVFVWDNVPETNGLTWEPVLHHKYMLVDAGYPDSDPIVVTGSMNWSNAGIGSNDESVLIWHHAEAAAQYRAEFVTRLEEAGGTLGATK